MSNKSKTKRVDIKGKSKEIINNNKICRKKKKY